MSFKEYRCSVGVLKVWVDQQHQPIGGLVRNAHSGLHLRPAGTGPMDPSGSSPVLAGKPVSWMLGERPHSGSVAGDAQPSSPRGSSPTEESALPEVLARVQGVRIQREGWGPQRPGPLPSKPDDSEGPSELLATCRVCWGLCCSSAGLPMSPSAWFYLPLPDPPPSVEPEDALPQASCEQVSVRI